MGTRVRKCALLTLLSVIVTISLGSALQVPNPHKNHEGVLESGKDEDITHWHGLDYEFGMFDHTSDGEEGKKKNTTEHDNGGVKNKTSVFQASAYEYHEDWDWDEWGGGSYEDDDYSESLEHQPHPVHDVITIGNKNVMTNPPKTTPLASSSKKPVSTQRPNSDRRKEVKDADYWNSDEGDSDDGLGNRDEGQEKKPLSNLPSDNDIDVDKYFNPDRYQDQINLHHIEDQILRVWTVQYAESHLPCIMLHGDIKLVVPVNPTWFNRDFVEIDVPQDAEASGSCNSLNNDYQEIKLRWNVTIPGRNKVYQNSVYFAFATNWTSEFSELKVPADKYALIAITVAYYNGEIGNGDDGLVSYSVSDLVEYMTPLNQSMSCFEDNQQLIIGNMQLTLSNIQLEAFRPNLETLTAGEFSRSVLCASDEVYIFDAVMTYIIWFWIGALLMVLFIFALLLVFKYRGRRCQEGDGGFGYKILQA